MSGVVVRVDAVLTGVIAPLGEHGKERMVGKGQEHDT
ncbi:hypothetical protein R54767_02588 [Paraburkholderia gardini]|uniref:Uncharacterized protein n=1 Tax=Paraburkholderia gardini TaxID=2823469 RepID=A0ABM8U3X6_9BURK|nr:hypothetical protein R54767_02588 [Paraburkholderia gardini]